MDRFDFRLEFLRVFGHGCSFPLYQSFSYLPTLKFWWLFTLGRYIFRHRFFCVFGDVFDALSNGIKVFHIFQFWFWENFWVRFALVLSHFLLLMRLQPCYTTDLWYVYDNEMLTTKIETSSNMGFLSALISRPKYYFGFVSNMTIWF